MNAESEVELMMQMDTGKFKAACAAVDLPPDSPADVLLDKIMGALNARDIEIERVRQGVKRQALGILGLVGLSFDDLHVWVTKKEEKKK